MSWREVLSATGHFSDISVFSKSGIKASFPLFTGISAKKRPSSPRENGKNGKNDPQSYISDISHIPVAGDPENDINCEKSAASIGSKPSGISRKS